MASTLSDERRAVLVERLAWLETAHKAHRRGQKRAPWWLLAALLAIPVHLMWGSTYSPYPVVFAATFALMEFYVGWNHQKECETEISAIRSLLDGDDEPAGDGADQAAHVSPATDTRVEPSKSPPVSADSDRVAHDRNRQRRRASL